MSLPLCKRICPSGCSYVRPSVHFHVGKTTKSAKKKGVAKYCTMVENRKKHRQNSHPIIYYPTSEEVSKVSERVSSASEQANGRAGGPVLQSVFLAIIDHSVRGQSKKVFLDLDHTEKCVFLHSHYDSV